MPQVPRRRFQIAGLREQPCPRRVSQRVHPLAGHIGLPAQPLDVPPRALDSNTGTTQDSQAGPRLTVGYVDLPGHPFYGREVRILTQHRKGNILSCLIASPDNPDLHYRLPARWLSPTPPPPAAAPARTPATIALSLAALDTVTQRFLALCATEASDAPTRESARDVPPDLGPTPAGDDRPPEPTAVPPRPESRGRREG